jgi:hypothetical protein
MNVNITLLENGRILKQASITDPQGRKIFNALLAKLREPEDAKVILNDLE